MKTPEEIAVHELLQNISYLQEFRNLSANLVLLSCGAGNACETILGNVLPEDCNMETVLLRTDTAFAALKKASDTAQTQGQKRWYDLLHKRYLEGATVEELSQRYSISKQTTYRNIKKAETAFALYFFENPMRIQ